MGSGFLKSKSLSISIFAATILAQSALADQSLNLNRVQVAENSEQAHLISRDKMRQSVAFDGKDILKNEPSIDIGGGNRNAQRIYLRGIESSNLNITIDGAKQGRSLFQHKGDMLGIDASLLKKVKVDTSSNGESSGLTGNIAFESIDAQDVLKESNFGGAFRAGYSSVSNGANGGVSLFGRFYKNGAFIFDTSGQNLKDYRTGSGEKSLYSASKDKNYFAKITILEGEHSLRLSALSNQNNAHYIVGGPGSDFGIPSPKRHATYNENSRDTYALKYQYSPENPYINIESRFYLNKKGLDNQTENLNVTNKNVGGVLKNGIYFELLGLQNSVDFGIDFDNEDSKTDSKINKHIINNGADNRGIFIHGDSQFSALRLSYGARFDDFESEFGSSKIKGDKLSPNFGIEYEIIDDLSLFARYSKAVRALGVIPVQWMGNITDKTNFNDGKALKPEESTQKEAGIKYATTLGGAQISLNGTLFKTELKNLVDGDGRGGRAVSRVWNLKEDIISKGYELRAHISGERFGVTLGYVKTKLENGSGAKFASQRRVAASSGDRFNLEGRYEILSGLSTGYAMRAVKGLEGVYGAKRSGYVLHDVWLEWLPKGVDGLSLNLALNNLTNKSYYAHTSFSQGDAIIEEPGRDFRVMMRYQF